MLESDTSVSPGDDETHEAPHLAWKTPWLKDCSCRRSMIILRSLVLLFAVISFAVGCSESPFSPTASESTSNALTLTGDTFTVSWNLVSIQPAGQAQQATPAGTTYTIAFSDGRLSTRADCNTCVGSYALSGQTLTAGPALACTRAACPTIAFENTYTSLLSGDHTVTMSGDTLVLSSARGVLRFAR